MRLDTGVARVVDTTRRWFVVRRHDVELCADGADPLAGSPAFAPRYELRLSGPPLCHNVTLLSLRLPPGGQPMEPAVFARTRNDDRLTLAHELSYVTPGRTVRRIAVMPPRVEQLYLESRSGSPVAVDRFRLYELGRVPLLATVGGLLLLRRYRDPRAMAFWLRRTVQAIRAGGVRGAYNLALTTQSRHQTVDPSSAEQADNRARQSAVASRTSQGRLAPDLAKQKRTFTATCRTALDRLLASDERIQLPRRPAPKISILLVLFNRAELTLACLRSIVDHAGDDVEVIVVDNASTDATAALLGRVDGAVVVRNEDNVGFVLACNQAATQARGEHLLLLNNDGVLRPGSITVALATLERDGDVGVVGAKIVRLDGTLQEAGNVLWATGSCMGYGRGDHPEAPEYQFRRDVDYVSGAFLLTRRRLWEVLGGFEEAFAPAYYEDTDYCQRVRDRGLRVVYEPAAEFLHFEYGSAAHTGQAIIRMKGNREVFALRHPATLAGRRGGPSPQNVLAARSADRRRRRVLVIDDRVPHTDLGGGAPRARRIIHTLVDLGYDVTLYPKQTPYERWDEVYATLPREVEVMVGHDTSMLGRFLEDRRGFYDVVIVSRPHNMRHLGAILDRRPDLLGTARLVYDAEAVFAIRVAQARKLAGETLDDAEVEQLVAEEIALATRARSVIAVSEDEAGAFRRHGHATVHVLAHAIDVAPTPRAFDDRNAIVFVGPLVEPRSPNGDSVRWFIDEVFPRIRAELRGRDVPFVVAGRCTPLISSRRPEGVHFLGRVDDLTGVYDSARLFVAPTRFAAGVPHKVHEAAARGVPVVTTDLIASQLGWRHGYELLASPVGDAEAFARHSVELYTDAGLWSTIREAALSRLEHECSVQTFSDGIDRVLREALA